MLLEEKHSSSLNPRIDKLDKFEKQTTASAEGTTIVFFFTIT